MTTEGRFDQGTSATDEVAYVQVGPPPSTTEGYVDVQVPDIQYSKFVFPLTSDFTWMLNRLQEFREAYLEAFPQGQPAPQRTVAPAQQAPQRQAPQGGGTGLWCPDHQVEMLKTSAQYDQTGDKFYHPLAEEDFYELADGRTVKNHNLFRSKLLTQAPAF